MTAHFLYLIACSARNNLRGQLRRMRSPRYAVAALVGLAYFFFIFGGWLSSDQAGAEIGGVWLEFGRTVGPLLVALFAARWWLWQSRHQGVRLTPAETHLLLPAPIARSQILRYKILQPQPTIFVSAAIAAYLTRGTDLAWPLRLLSVWVLLATLHQHQVAASLVQASAQQHGRSGLRRNIVPLLLFGGALAVLVWSLLGAAADIRAQRSIEFIAERLTAMMHEPGPRVVLAPFRFLLAPTLASAAADWLPAFAGALAVLALHYLWVVRSDAAFEEAAAERGAYIARLSEAARTGGASRLRLLMRDPRRRLARPWLPLAASGRRAYAIFWKNILYVQRSFKLSMLVRLVLLILLVTVLSSRGADTGDVAQMFAVLFLMAGVAATVLGPLAFRNDLRTDLAYVDLLRTYPIDGRGLVAAGLAASALCVTATQFLLLAVGLALLVLNGGVPVGTAAAFAAAGLFGLPIINSLAILIQNAMALLYPSWVRIGEAGGGVQMMGQTVVILVGTAVMLLLLSILPLLAGGIVGGPLVMLIGSAGVVAGAAAAFIVAAGEVALLTLWLGRLYDRTDPVAAGLLR